MQTVTKFHVCVSIIVLLAGASRAGAKYAGGAGTPDDPYQIATAADLIALGESPGDYDKHFVLTADIDLDPNLPGRKVFDGAVIAPDVGDTSPQSGYVGTPFTGVFDGQGHTLSHLSIEGKDYVGLFGKVGSGAMIARLGLEAVDVNATGHVIGALAGHSEGCVLTSHSTGRVKRPGGVGDLARQNEGGIIASYSTASASEVDRIGGLVGANTGGIIASYSAATVSGSGWLGGLVGMNTGGIVASYSSGTVSGLRYIGGLAGTNEGSIVASYSTGTASGREYIGGLVGEIYWSGGITMCYSTTAVSGGRCPGGLVGDPFGENFVVASFWDMETSGQTVSGGGRGLTTAQMQDIKTFLDAGWDFVDETHHGTCDYWEMSAGEYPRLRFHAGAGPVMPEGAGTAEQPYVIRDARDLGTVWFEPLAHYALANQVDLQGITWSGAVIPWFNGTFEGRYGGLRSLHIRGSGYLGLFGQLDAAATISLLDLVGTEVAGTGDNIGGLVGVNRGTITDCCSIAGVVLGGVSRRTITDCNSIAGVVESAEVGNYVGGLAGKNYGSIVNGRSDGVVIGGHYSAGGLVGHNPGRIAASHASGSVEGNHGVGGLVGAVGGTITASYSTGAVSGANDVGGLLGAGPDVELISACYSTGAVSGVNEVGGLVGWLGGGAVRDSYSVSAVIGNEDVGGLVGRLSFAVGVMSRCYSVSAINGKSYVGPLAGLGHPDAMSDCLWDTQVCGRTTGEGGIGKTTAEMQTAATFLALGWDFVGETANGTEDIWWIDEGKDYPHLWWEPSEE